jgi:hypothetical protein
MGIHYCPHPTFPLWGKVGWGLLITIAAGDPLLKITAQEERNTISRLAFT